MLPTYYSAGTVSVANGATSVIGTGTLWGSDAILPGDLLFDPAQPTVPPQRVASVEGNGALTLAYGWPGTSMVSDAYEIRYVGNQERSTAQSRRYLELLGQLQPLGLQPRAFGEGADRDEYDGAEAGFIFLDLGDPWTLYIKETDADADWDAGQVVKGPKGDPGNVDSSNGTVTDIIKISQAAYDALDPPAATTLYIITED